MSQFKSFFMQNALKTEEIEVHVSDRFVDEEGKPEKWKVTPITEAQNTQLRKQNTKRVKGKAGQFTNETDTGNYMASLIVACVTFPDLKNAELQNTYGVMSAESLIQKMLLPGEYGNLVEKIQEINGFDIDPNEVIDEVKN